MRILNCRRCDEAIKYHRDFGSGRLPWYCRPCIEEIYVERIQARNAADRAKRRGGVTRYAAIVVTRLCLRTAASGGICTYIAGHVFKSARTFKTAGHLREASNTGSKSA